MDRLALFLILAALGFAGGVAWEHHGPLPFPASLAGPSLAQERDQARSDLEVAEGDVKRLRAALDAQNRAVDTLKADSAARLAVSAKAQADARSVAESYRRAAQTVLDAKPQGSDLCAAADALILEHVQ